MSFAHSSSLWVFLVAIAGGVVPLFLSRTDRWLHRLVALAAGVFLGTVFLHLLPGVAAASAVHAHESGGHEHAVSMHPWGWALLGVVGFFVLENVVFHGRAHRDHAHTHDHPCDDGQHRLVGIATLFGLSIHAFTAGLGLGVAIERPELEAPLLASILGHKAVEGFSLATVVLLAGFGPWRFVPMLVGFALVTPIGVEAGAALVPRLDASGIAAFTALAAGTFLYVALVDLLPEVFHRREDLFAKLALFAGGLGLAFFVG